jgi:hypothetical protein
MRGQRPAARLWYTLYYMWSPIPCRRRPWQADREVQRHQFRPSSGRTAPRIVPETNRLKRWIPRSRIYRLPKGYIVVWRCLTDDALSTYRYTWLDLKIQNITIEWHYECGYWGSRAYVL